MTQDAPAKQEVEIDPKGWDHARLFCDVIMKGGVTSGVVYPYAITRLATKYVFRNIAGTSVGAIAAVLTAAAEYDRRFHGSVEGFTKFQLLPKFLSSEAPNGQTNLLRQFWADKAEMRWQLDAALKLVGSAPLQKKLAVFELWLAWRYWPVWVIVGGLLLFLADPLSDDPGRSWRLALATLLTLASSAAILPVVYILRVVDQLQKNDFGWCHGHSQANDPPSGQAVRPSEELYDAPLSDWLADAIDDTAGILKRKTPLTFGMLKAKPERGPFPPGVVLDGDPTINVAMMTTCLTLQQSFSLPFSRAASPDRFVQLDDAYQPPFWWKADEFAKFFPSYVIDHLKSVGQPTAKVTRNGQEADEYYLFPKADDLPLVVAARMSLSFPVLLCAVPLYKQRGPNNEFVRVWFSDGGLTSNLPIHFFDDPLPRWPTFALDLLGTNRANAQTPFIESKVPADDVEAWERLETKKGLDLIAFFSSIIDTTRTWRDRVLGRLPGYADRTVGIRLTADEGGLNLNMDKTLIDKLGGYGDSAGQTLIEAFAPPNPAPGNANVPVDSPWWRGHRWTRYAAVTTAYKNWIAAYHSGYKHFANWQGTYDDMIAQAYAAGGVQPGAIGTPSAGDPARPAGAYPDQLTANAALVLAQQLSADGAAVAEAAARPAPTDIAPQPYADLGPKAPF